KLDRDIVLRNKYHLLYLMELYYGPTLAFKDMALTIMPHLLKTSIKKDNLEKDVVILTATSGDTGKAALEGFKDID
ncbi:threonine synthase, partial [Clostridioides difficile]|nr:threonine synthase [Clostridioides difficile]